MGLEATRNESGAGRTRSGRIEYRLSGQRGSDGAQLSHFDESLCRDDGVRAGEGGNSSGRQRDACACRLAESKSRNAETDIKKTGSRSSPDRSSLSRSSTDIATCGYEDTE